MNKYGNQDYNPQYPQYNPGGSQPYAPPSGAPPSGYGGPPPPNNGYGGEKDPYEGDRFKPKKSFKDPIFLVLFIAQVRITLHPECMSGLTFFFIGLLTDG